MKRILLTQVLFIHFVAYCQSGIRQPNGGGSYLASSPVNDEITPQERASIIQQLKANEASLRSSGKLVLPENPTFTAFAWPLKQAPGYNDNGYYGISNYVDENPSFPNLLLDYNCGTRTYDQASGYNHAEYYYLPDIDFYLALSMEKNGTQYCAGDCRSAGYYHF